jgi:hypothetical protein
VSAKATQARTEYRLQVEFFSEDADAEFLRKFLEDDFGGLGRALHGVGDVVDGEVEDGFAVGVRCMVDDPEDAGAAVQEMLGAPGYRYGGSIKRVSDSTGQLLYEVAQ